MFIVTHICRANSTYETYGPFPAEEDANKWALSYANEIALDVPNGLVIDEADKPIRIVDGEYIDDTCDVDELYIMRLNEPK
jgi:hypothetical protein